jgi:tape measure domain-containing protein
MAGRVVHAVDVEITGELDPSLAKAIGMTEAEFKRLISAQKTFNSLMSKMVAPREAVNAANQIGSAITKMETRSSEATRRMRENMEKVGEAGKKAAEKIQGSLAKAFDSIVEHGMHLTGIGGILGSIGGAFAGEEFIRGAFEVRAERGVLQNQLRSVTEAAGRGYLAPQIDTLLRNMEGRETPVRYKQLLETSNLLLAAAPERFKDVDAMHKMLGQLADVSRDPQAFQMVSQAFTRILAEGKVDAQHLNEMSQDSGFAFREAMAKALKVTPEQLADLLKKHKLTGEQQIQALMTAFGELTGPGGAGYKHAEAQLQGLSGLQSMFIGHWEDFQESFGIQLENFLQPIADKVFKILTPGVLVNAFNQLTPYVKGFGAAVAQVVDNLQHGQAAERLRAIGQAFSVMFGKMFGTSGFGKFYQDILDPISGAWRSQITASGKAWQDMISGQWTSAVLNALGAVRSTVEFIQQHFNTILGWAKGIAVALTAAKGVELFNKFAEAFKTIKALTIGAGVVYVNGPVAEGEGGGRKVGGIVGALIEHPWIGGTLAVLAGLQQGYEAYKWSRTPAGTAAIISDERARTAKAGTVAGQYSLANFPDSPAMREYAQKHQENAQAVDKATAATNSASSALNRIPMPAGSVASSLNSLASKISSFQMPTLPAIPLAPVAPHQHGGIAIRPHVGLVGEAGPEAIIPLKKGGGGLLGSVTVNAPIKINGAAGGGSDLGAILAEHARAIAREVQRVVAIEYENQAVV